MVLLNRDRAMTFMRQCGLDAIVASSTHNVTYLSDYACWIDSLFKAYMMRPGAPTDLNHNYAVLPAESEAGLVLPAIWAANAGDAWVRDLWLHGAGDLDLSAVPAALSGDLADLHRRVQDGQQRSDAVDALRALLQQRGLASARIGIEFDGLSEREQQRAREALPQAHLLDCSNLLRLIRMVKSDEELRRLERSTQINYGASQVALSAARRGDSLRELRDRYVALVVAAGAGLDHFIASPGGTGIQQAPNYRLADGDVLYVDYGCVYEHYYSDNGTTLIVGECPPEMDQRYTVLREGLRRGVDLLRPGVQASAIRQAMIDALAEGGIHGSNAHGHGIGLEVRDYPIIMPDNGLRIRDDCVDVASDVPLEAGMVVNLELPLYLFGVGSLHMEQTFLITTDGCRRLDSSEPTVPIQVAREVATA
jgi:Xaa-Pro dipeptidase